MKIAVIGAGYVGLTTGACLAELGHVVVCVDIDRARVASLRNGLLPVFEPGLNELVAGNMAAGRLSFSDDPVRSARSAAAVFVAVGTPSREDGSIDLSYVEAAARQIGPALKPGAVLVVKSTVVPGTTRRLQAMLGEMRSDVSVASNPEFLREGSAVGDFLAPDRIVIGADDLHARQTLARIYAPLLGQGFPCLHTSTVNAETIKYASNALLALKIGFINEIADFCEQIGAEIAPVANGLGMDQRIGAAGLAAGPGFGGSCFPKDTRALAAAGRQAGAPLRLVETLIACNEARKISLASRIIRQLGDKVRGARVALFGVAFKANTDDIRESAALSIAPLLLEAGCQVRLHDPQASAPKAIRGARWYDDPYEAATRADMVVVLTEWDDYRDLDLQRLARRVRQARIFDCRNVVDSLAAEEAGFEYMAIGRSSPVARFEQAVPLNALAADSSRPFVAQH